MVSFHRTIAADIQQYDFCTPIGEPVLQLDVEQPKSLLRVLWIVFTATIERTATVTLETGKLLDQAQSGIQGTTAAKLVSTASSSIGGVSSGMGNLAVTLVWSAASLALSLAGTYISNRPLTFAAEPYAQLIVGLMRREVPDFPARLKVRAT